MRSSFWFLPSVMTAGAIVMSFVLIAVDDHFGSDLVERLGWLYTFGPEGARAILSTIAGSMMTVAGLTFSITMLTLQLASSQFGPRLLRNFMRDRGNQTVLGTFIATFIYCLLVLRSVRGTEDSPFVPHLAVAIGVVFAVASLGVLIYFIHHIATSVRIETLLGRLGSETGATIDALYPERIGSAPSIHADAASLIPADFDTASRPVAASRSGYVQRLDADALVRIAGEHDLIIRVDARPGSFLREGAVLFSAWPAARITDAVAHDISGTLAIGSQRTPDQDLAFSLRLIVEIAQRALSPGINDPTTALYCIDRVGDALARLGARAMPSPLRLDEQGRLRVIADPLSLHDLAVDAFSAIGRYGLADADVMVRLIRTVDSLIPLAPPEGSMVLVELRDSMRREALTRLALSSDRAAVAAAAGDGA